MALSLSDITTKITQFETVVLSNYPGTTGMWHVGANPEQITFHLVGAGVSVQCAYVDEEVGWHGMVNGVRYDGATALEALQNTATAAKAIRQTDSDEAGADVTVLTDQG